MHDREIPEPPSFFKLLTLALGSLYFVTGCLVATTARGGLGIGLFFAIIGGVIVGWHTYLGLRVGWLRQFKKGAY